MGRVAGWARGAGTGSVRGAARRRTGRQRAFASDSGHQSHGHRLFGQPARRRVLPQLGRDAQGLPLVTLVNRSVKATIVAFLPVGSFEVPTMRH
jgi:hypothetical protein